jgi:hypothetical protein
LVELLKEELIELAAKEQQLIRVNNALTEVVRKTESVAHLEEASWKQKYEEQLQNNYELRKRLAELESRRDAHCFSSLDEPSTPKKSLKQSYCESGPRQRSGNNNENHRSNSISRMEDFMKSGMPRVGEFSSSTRRTTLTNGKKGKGEIVLRIVDDRLNRKYC